MSEKIRSTQSLCLLLSIVAAACGGSVDSDGQRSGNPTGSGGSSATGSGGSSATGTVDTGSGGQCTEWGEWYFSYSVECPSHHVVYPVQDVEGACTAAQQQASGSDAGLGGAAGSGGAAGFGNAAAQGGSFDTGGSGGNGGATDCPTNADPPPYTGTPMGYCVINGECCAILMQQGCDYGDCCA